MWVRKSYLWTTECDQPLSRRGDSCTCCSCPAGFEHDGSICEPCKAYTYKAVPGFEPCTPCTDVSEAGLTACPNTLELVVSTRDDVYATDADDAGTATGVIALRVQLKDPVNATHTWWSDEITAQASFLKGDEWNSGVIRLPFVGVPIKVEYGVRGGVDAYAQTWQPKDIKVIVSCVFMCVFV
jgi:hypothetical protein